METTETATTTNVNEQKQLLCQTEYYKLLRSQIEHEDNLTNARLSWFTASQAAIFAVFAVAQEATQMPQEFFVGLAFFGVLLCFTTFTSVHAAVRSIHSLSDQYAQKYRDNQLPPLVGGKNTHLLGLVLPYSLPVLFFLAWIFMLVIFM